VTAAPGGSDVIGADPEGLLEKRQNAYCYAHAHLGQDALAKDWMRALRGRCGVSVICGVRTPLTRAKKGALLRHRHFVPSVIL
jgi:hypothetical protein